MPYAASCFLVSNKPVCYPISDNPESVNPVGDKQVGVVSTAIIPVR